MVLVLSGSAPDALLVAFWAQTAPRTRAHAISFLGRELALPPDKLPAEARARGLAYWDKRLAAGLASEAQDAFQEELSSIGQWCGQENIDAAWLLDQLMQMLSGGFSPKTGYQVTDWLGKIAEAHPDKSVDVLHALLSSPRLDRWTYINSSGIYRTGASRWPCQHHSFDCATGEGSHQLTVGSWRVQLSASDTQFQVTPKAPTGGKLARKYA